MTGPERIWAWPNKHMFQGVSLAGGSTNEEIEYIRADLADTATWNAAIRAAAEKFTKDGWAQRDILALLKP